MNKNNNDVWDVWDEVDKMMKNIFNSISFDDKKMIIDYDDDKNRITKPKLRIIKNKKRKKILDFFKKRVYCNTKI